ncbi:unnamed protein product [Owenia fusiformis]|uniref:Uncharacterized protein n=1 Tax=Owenia fusiformis TaxID=6347 RepID=A0A8J1U415_OWEFU|nr:unnamed protein product [Owenia fusiformis]
MKCSLRKTLAILSFTAITTFSWYSGKIGSKKVQNTKKPQITVKMSAANEQDSIITYEQYTSIPAKILEKHFAVNGQYTTFNTDIVVYNRLAKCGSTTLFRIVQQVSSDNNFTFVMDHNDSSTVNFNDKQIVNYIDSFSKPVFYVRHMSFVNFTAFGKQHPVYIQMLRDPVERVISGYYYYDFHFGHHKGIRLEKCLVYNMKCGLLKPGDMRNQFCDRQTRKMNKCTIEHVKRIIEKDYIFVGITEHFSESIKAFAKLLPKYFPENATIAIQNSAKEARGSSNLRPPDRIMNFLAKRYEIDYEVYNFAKQHFYKRLSEMGISYGRKVQ